MSSYSRKLLSNHFDEDTSKQSEWQFHGQNRPKTDSEMSRVLEILARCPVPYAEFELDDFYDGNLHLSLPETTNLDHVTFIHNEPEDETSVARKLVEIWLALRNTDKVKRILLFRHPEKCGTFKRLPDLFRNSKAAVPVIGRHDPGAAAFMKAYVRRAARGGAQEPKCGVEPDPERFDLLFQYVNHSMCRVLIEKETHHIGGSRGIAEEVSRCMEMEWDHQTNNNPRYKVNRVEVEDWIVGEE